jgi:DNA-binding response OmpR family regulator
MTKVLIVDDAASHRRTLALWLSEHGLGVDVAGTAESALKSAGVFRPDVLRGEVRSAVPGTE